MNIFLYFLWEIGYDLGINLIVFYLSKGSSYRFTPKQSRQFMGYAHRLCWHIDYAKQDLCLI